MSINELKPLLTVVIGSSGPVLISWLNNRKKLQQIHILVNNRLTASLRFNVFTLEALAKKNPEDADLLQLLKDAKEELNVAISKEGK